MLPFKSTSGISVKNGIYVAVVSEHNVAEARAIRATAPERVLLVVSERMTGRGVLLQAFAEREGASVEALTGLGGDGYLETRRWAEQQLVPKLRGAAGPIALNLTGGTKACALALRDAWAWDAIHYVALDSNEMELVPARRAEGPPIPLPELGPYEQAGLYARITERGARITAERGLLDELYRAWEPAGEQHPFWAVRRGLEALRAEMVARRQAPKASRSGSLILPVPADARALVERLAALARGVALQFEEDGLRVEGGDRAEDWIRYLEGGWYEDIVAAWVREELGPERVEQNLLYQLADEGRPEVDVVALVRGRLRVIEVKCGAQAHIHRLGELSDKLGETSRHLGNTLAALVGTPDFGSHKARNGSNQSLDDFRRLLAARRQALCLSREELVAWLRSRGG